MIGDKSKIGRHMVMNMVYKVLGLAVGLIYVPILLNYLGDEKFGIWTTINTFVSWIIYFDIGIGNGLRNRLTETISQNDVYSQQKTVSTAYISISLITGFLFCISMIAMSFMDVPNLLNLTIAGENIKAVIILNIAFVCINFVLSLCNTILYALQLSSVVSLISLIPQILNVSCIYVLSRTTGSNLIVMSLLYGVTVLMTNLITSSIIFGKYKNLRPSFKLFDREEMGYISGFGIKMFTVQIAALILNSTDNILITKIYGAENVTPYNMVYRVFSYINSFQAALIIPMLSAYTRAKAQRNYNWLTKGLRRMQFLLIPFASGAVLLMFIFKDLSYIWLGKALNYTPMLIVVTGFYFIILMWTNIYSSFLCGVGRINMLMWISIFQAVLNIPLSLLFSVELGMGLSGIILGSLTVMLIAAIMLPIEVKKYLKDI